jgi:hypothetical protein
VRVPSRASNRATAFEKSLIIVGDDADDADTNGHDTDEE